MSRPQGYSPNEPIGKRIRDLPACSAVPQPTAPPRTPLSLNQYLKWPATLLLFSDVRFCTDLSPLFFVCIDLPFQFNSPCCDHHTNI